MGIWSVNAFDLLSSATNYHLLRIIRAQSARAVLHSRQVIDGRDFGRPWHNGNTLWIWSRTFGFGLRALRPEAGIELPHPPARFSASARFSLG